MFQSSTPPSQPPNIAWAMAAGGANALLQAAIPLLVLAGRLRGQITQTDIEHLRRQASQEVRGFEERARQSGIPAEDALAARYALCTVVDEAVLNTPWGAQSGWAGQSLLVTFHRESSGGEKFFQILDRVQAEPQRYIALLELLYACLALGFEGRFRLDERGPVRLAEIRHNLYRTIQGVRGPAETDLSPRWKGVEDRRNAVVRLVPLWVVAAACGALLLAAFIVFSARLSGRADALNAMLANIGLEPLFAASPRITVAPPVSFRTLLAQQIAAGAVSVDESADGRTLITVTAPDLFASASASVNPVYSNLLSEIGSAAEKVPGQVLIVGHTDDQPLRSLRYQDNFELSRARALEVATILKSVIRDPSRVDFAGKGSSEPRFIPAGAPENRARNRRVEIIHRRGG